MSETVTIAKVVTLDEQKPIQLPADFIQSLKSSEEGSGHAVMILAPSTKIIRIIPTKSSEVIKVAIEIGELSPDFLQELGVVFMRSKIRTLYSTGLCFTADRCLYEGYIDSIDMSISQEELKNQLMEIRGVANVEISVLTI